MLKKAEDPSSVSSPSLIFSNTRHAATPRFLVETSSFSRTLR
jgi:hypothetical protein